MRAVVLNESHGASRVAKRDKVLAEHAHAQGIAVRVWQLGAEGERLPEAAQQVAHRGARSNAGQQLVLFTRQHPPSIRHTPADKILSKRSLADARERA